MSGVFLGTTSNMSLIPVDDRLVSSVEVVIFVSQPLWQLVDGNITKNRQCSELRFVAHPSGLREMAKHLEDMADEAEALQLKVETK